MKFTEKNIKNLEKHMGKIVSAKGINDKGKQFETQGVLIDLNKEMIFIQQTIKPTNESYNHYDVITFDINYGKYHFMLLDLYNDKGKLIFENQDKKKIVTTATKYGIKKSFEKLEKGEDIISYDPVSEKLKTMIGKPIILTTESDNPLIKDIGGKGIFYGFNGMDLQNNNVVYISMVDIPICKNTILKTITPDGEVKLVEDNNKYDLTDMWKTRRDYMLKVGLERREAKELEEAELKRINENDDWWQEK